MREIKASFDPHNLFNPGKVVPDGRFKIDTDLRQGAGRELKLPFAPVLAFAAKDGSFIAQPRAVQRLRRLPQGNARPCAPPSSPPARRSCPHAAGPMRFAPPWNCAAWPAATRCARPRLEAALSNCLSCKACTTECPSNVNLALLKAELLHARIRRDGLSWRERLLSSVDLLGRLGCRLPRLANAALDSLFAAQPSVASCWAWPGSGRCRTTPGNGSTAGSRAGSARRSPPARARCALGRYLRAVPRAPHRHCGG